MVSPASEERLQKYLARCGVGSRRRCEQYIAEGVVTVNGAAVTEVGVKVRPGADTVCFRGREVRPKAGLYIIFNKPRGLLTACEDRRGMTVVEYLRRHGITQRIFPVGRLDRDTDGLLLLTNDGDFANRLMHPRYAVGKTYCVTLNVPLAAADKERLEQGMELDDGRTSPAEVKLPGQPPNRVYLTIHEGRNRLVRRMFDALDYRVEQLTRVKIGNLGLQRLKTGQFRKISKGLLLKLIGGGGAADD